MLINQQEHHGILVFTMRMEINAYATHGSSLAMSTLYSGLAPGRGEVGYEETVEEKRKKGELEGKTVHGVTASAAGV